MPTQISARHLVARAYLDCRYCCAPWRVSHGNRAKHVPWNPRDPAWDCRARGFFGGSWLGSACPSPEEVVRPSPAYIVLCSMHDSSAAHHGFYALPRNGPHSAFNRARKSDNYPVKTVSRRGWGLVGGQAISARRLSSAAHHEAARLLHPADWPTYPAFNRPGKKKS